HGMPFRQAHAVVGGLVRDSIERHVPLAELVEAHPALGSEAVALLEPGVAVTRRATPGGAGPEAVKKQMARFLDRLELDRRRIPMAEPGVGSKGRARSRPARRRKDAEPHPRP